MEISFIAMDQLNYSIDYKAYRIRQSRRLILKIGPRVNVDQEHVNLNFLHLKSRRLLHCHQMAFNLTENSDNLVKLDTRSMTTRSNTPSCRQLIRSNPRKTVFEKSCTLRLRHVWNNLPNFVNMSEDKGPLTKLQNSNKHLLDATTSIYK